MKKTTMRKTLIASLTMAFSVCMGVSTLCISASAEEAAPVTVDTATVTMAKGASARISEDGKNGLRYTMETSESDYKGLRATYGTDITFGILIAPDSYTDMTEETVFGANAIYDWATYDEATGDWVYNGDGSKTRIINLYSSTMNASETDASKYVLYGTVSFAENETAALWNEFTGVGYIAYTVDGVTDYKFLNDNDNTRSMAYVAQVYQTLDDSVVSPEDKATVLATYITGKADQVDTFYTVNHMLSDGNGNYTVGETEEVTAKINGTTVAPTAKTFDGYTFDQTNANNATGGELVYADGKTTANIYYVNNVTRLMNKDGDTYTPANGVLNYRSAFAYTNYGTYSDTVVYSVKVSAPEGVHRYYGQPPQLGITLMNQTPYTEMRTAHNLHSTQWGDAPSIQLGITDCGIWATAHHISGGNARRLDMDGADRWDNGTGTGTGVTPVVSSRFAIKGNVPEGFDSNLTCNTDSTITERVFTVVLYKDTLYMYVDSVYAGSVAITNTDYFAAADFSAGSKYTFGVQMTNFNTASTKNPSVTFLDAKYGEEALAELKTNALYENAGVSARVQNMTKNADGTVTAPKGWQSYGYRYTTKTAATTAVYSVKVTGSAAITGSSYWSPCVGITVTNGTIIDSADCSYTDYRDVSRTLPENTYYGTCFGLTNDRNLKMFSGKSMNALNMTSFNENLMLTATNLERTLTLVLYNDTFYFYIDGTHVQTIAVDNTGFQPAKATNSGKTYGYAKGDAFLFGVSAHNEESQMTFSNIVEKYGEDALAELASNPLYANVGVTA